jgi:hypothetical protein
MHYLSPYLRTLVRAGSRCLLVSICLLSASAASAATAPRSGRGVCDSHTTARRMVRHPKSFGGPVKLPPERALLGLDELAAHISGRPHGFGDENQAIQNDVPAARIDAGDAPVPSLRIVGLLVGSIDLHPCTRDCAPKSPRGPPIAV